MTAAFFAGTAVVATILSLLAPSVSRAQQAVTSVSSLGAARVSRPATGTIVVSMDANGDLPGMLTLTLRVQNRSVVGGEWALVLSSRQPGVVGSAPAARGPETSEAEVPADQVGVLAGVVEPGGTVTIARDGTVTGVSGVLLTIARVTPLSPGVIGQHGRADASAVNDYARSHGQLTLTF